MAKKGRDPRKAHDHDKAANADGSTSFAWEFGPEERVASATDPATEHVTTSAREASGAPRETTRTASQVPRAEPRDEYARSRRQDANGAPRVMDASQIRRVSVHLDRAMERWWALGELPPLALLRDGLFALEAGAPLTESQRTLLLRAALAHDRGVQTALRYQVDNERVALVLAEAAVEWEAPLDAFQIENVIGANQPLRHALVAELERSRVLLIGAARQRAQAVLDQLERTSSHVPGPVVGAGAFAAAAAAPMPRRKPLRQIILLLLLVALVGFVMWQRRQERPAGMIAMPAASYALRDADGSGVAGVQLAAFWIDQQEVTNRAYRDCLQAGGCAWPVSVHSAMRLDYFTNPAFDDYPVVNVTYAMADAYCTWRGKRLPTAEEWQAAASVSPVNGQAFLYPWGETFDAQRANSASSGLGDTVATGTFRPSGDSPAGVAEMAGNVAEWSAARGGVALVMGGSFVDAPEALTVGSGVESALDVAAPQIGFRCARARLLTPS